MAVAAILFLIDSSQKLTRSSEIRYLEYQIEPDHQKYLENNRTKFECNPSNGS